MTTHPFAKLVIRSVLFTFLIWGGVVVYNVVNCKTSGLDRCEAEVKEVGSTAIFVSSTLLAWLADSPLTGGDRSPTRRQARRTTSARKEP